ncbi:YkyA family protein [Virgibacillus oceani]|uniref:Lipoprotein n=1 Tax=Virgibacillus oceani TaxID=1479511 RepID=A0A917H7P1_9BACI|nr:YkyA family protein [Virgibacillus oceani]GGG70190.1 lipoprotein [Virgibacillus oceani]
MIRKKAIVILAILCIILLSACTGASTKDEIYDHLEKAVTLEDAFEKQQDSIVELEKEEQQLYSQIIDLGMDEFDKIKQLSKQAIESIEKRTDKIKLEKESIDASKEEFQEIKELIADLEEDKVRKKANEMYDVMMNRYEAYEKLNNAYNNSLKLEKELYTMLQDKDMKQEKLTDHISNINESYQKVLDANDKFNASTTDYNALKKEFYDLAGIDVKYEADVPDSKGGKQGE